MRILFLLFAALGLSTGAPDPVSEARMPLKILRQDGLPARMGEVYLEVGASREPLTFDIWFDSDGTVLGKPRLVSWRVDLTAYCRDTPSWVRSVLIGPSGQIWSGSRVFVPAGPDRTLNDSEAMFGARNEDPDARSLLDAAASGGRFTLALQDDDGRRLSETTVDTLDPQQRDRLFAANRAEVAAASLKQIPVAGAPVIAVIARPPTTPASPRPCPAESH